MRWALIGVAALVLAAAAAVAIFLSQREPDPGGATVVVTRQGGGAIPGARLTLAGVLRLTGANGLVTYVGLKPGPHELVASAPGFGGIKRMILVESGKQRQFSVALRDASLSGHFEEIAAAPSPPTGTRIFIRPKIGEPVRVNVQRDGSFSVDHAPVGLTELEIDAQVQSNVKGRFDRYDKTHFPVALKPGQNTIQLKSPISAVETMVRYFSLLEDGRYPNALRAGRLYHHSDSKRYGCSAAKYARLVVAAAAQGALDTDFQFLRATTRRHWTFAEAGKRFRYRNAAEMAVRLRYAFGSETSTVHAVRRGSFWKAFPICG